MNASLAAAPLAREASQPDISWIKQNVPVLAVGRALGLRIRHQRARCWRPENHAHGDADPSLRFFERGNRVRCFVCDMRGGHSCIDLVMGVLCADVGTAVRWIAERFTVPSIKSGRPVGHRTTQLAPYRAGVHGSELEFLVRSGMFGQLSSAESRILVTLAIFREPDSGITKLSYQAIMRYSGVGSRANVARALAQLQRLHAIQISLGPRIGITRECSSYRVTLDDPKFYDLCNEVCRIGREQVAQERVYRSQLRAEREKKARDARHKNEHRRQTMKDPARKGAIKPRLALNMTEAGGLRPPDPPLSGVSPSRRNPEENTSTCAGLNLSSAGELNSNKSVPGQNRGIGVLEGEGVGESSDY